VYAVDVYRALRALYEERQKLDQVIAALEDLQRRSAERVEAPPQRRGRKFMDEASRKQVSERMKAYWAARKADKKTEHGYQ
jgi:hypothetical protein